MANIRPEAELLLCCARARLEAETSARIRTLLQQDIDWPYLLRTARSHGIMPLLYWHLNATCAETIPKASLNQLRDHFNANAQRNLFLTGELLALLKLFEAHGIPAVPYKGPALAASAYGNLALRQFRDLDIVVRKRDALNAKDLLIAQGYRPTVHLTPAQEAAYLRSQYEYEFLREDGKVVVELHWGVTPRYFSFSPNFDRLWERLKPVSLAGTSVWTFAPEDVLLMLCVHGTKHCWGRLEWICTVAELIGANEKIDWNQLMVQAGILGSKRILLLGLALASDLLGAVLPAEILRVAQADQAVGALKALIQRRLFLEKKPSGLFESALFHLKTRERLRDRIRYCLRLAMTTTARDWTAAQIPPLLSFLYYPIRAIRLTKKYSPSILTRVWLCVRC